MLQFRDEVTCSQASLKAALGEVEFNEVLEYSLDTATSRQHVDIADDFPGRRLHFDFQSGFQIGPHYGLPEVTRGIVVQGAARAASLAMTARSFTGIKPRLPCAIGSSTMRCCPGASPSWPVRAAKMRCTAT